MSTAWTIKHDLLYLFMAIGVADGRFGRRTQLQTAKVLQSFMPAASPDESVALSKAVQARFHTANNGVEFFKLFEQSAQRVGAKFNKRRDRRVTILKGIRSIAYAAGAPEEKVVLLLRSATAQLDLFTVVRFSDTAANTRMMIKKAA